MDIISSYLPMDRRQALAAGRDLPVTDRGAALFADISGFTPLTEALARRLGLQRGAEELTGHLNRVYDPLIEAVHRYGGSVLGFAGDSITCWFSGDDGRRATAAALTMQHTMQTIGIVPMGDEPPVRLTLKTAVAAGPVRRLLVGAPAQQRYDVLAGTTLERMAAAEHLAQGGEVVVDAATAAALGDTAQIAAWRVGTDDGASGERFAVVGSLADPPAPQPWSALAPDAFAADALRPWLLPTIFDRIQKGYGEFLSELRPAVALFLRFGGHDYEADPQVGARLDAWIRFVQQVLARYDGTLIQLTVGDKGSYLYAAFGAPITHADDAGRAAAAALDLIRPPADLGIEPVQIGISAGRMRTGSYGAHGSRTYGALGDDTNLAARLMQAAAPGQILVSRSARQLTGDNYRWEPLPPLRVKGKAAPVAVSVLLAAETQGGLQLPEPHAVLPLVGRAAELAAVSAALDGVRAGRGAVIGLTAEGMGKSRLVAEIVARARQAGFTVYGGASPAYGTPPPYQVWQPIARGLFGVDPAAPAGEAIAAVQARLAAWDSALLPRLPLLGALLDLPIPDSDLTAPLDAATRKTALESLLIECLRHVTADPTHPALLLVFEDAHWMDPLSRDLLLAVGRALPDRRLALLAAYRPAGAGDSGRLAALTGLPHAQELPLTEFAPEEAEALIAAKLAAMTGDARALPPDLVVRVRERAGGNPFYIEELLNYWRDAGLDPTDPATMEALDLPDNLYSLLLSRIDALAESQQITLKVASAAGRAFRPSWLRGMYPDLDDPIRLLADLDLLNELDLTPLDAPLPEITYLFKHLLTQEAAYSSLTFELRNRLHGKFAAFLEATTPPDAEPPVVLLAHHYGMSDNTVKKQEYLQRAGDLLAGRFDNVGAIACYDRLLPMLAEADHRPVRLKLGAVLEHTGAWENAATHYQAVRDSAQAEDHGEPRAEAHYRLGRVARHRETYAEALACLDSAEHACPADAPGAWAAPLRARIQSERGIVAFMQGDYATATTAFSAARTLAEDCADAIIGAETWNWLGNVAMRQGAFADAQRAFETARDLCAERGDKPGQARAFMSLAGVAWYREDFAAAAAALDDSLALRRQIGDRPGMAALLNNLGVLARDSGDAAGAAARWEESLALKRELDSKADIAITLANLGGLAFDRGDWPAAHAYAAEAADRYRALGNKAGLAWALVHLGQAVQRLGRPAEAESLFEEALTISRTLDDTAELGRSLKSIGLSRYDTGAHAEAGRLWREGLRLLHDQGRRKEAAVCLTGLAALAATTPAHRVEAVSWLALVETTLTGQAAQMTPHEQALYAETLAALRAALDPATFAAAWEAGLGLSWDETVQSALREES
jgi:class 3 adenylate cyclase/tetratricopeptide (TPR) repeat protein